jgi:ankyrin repeat protein
MRRTQQLCQAVASGSDRQVKALIREGADINGVDVTEARTPLTTAIDRGRTDMAMLLLQLGADPAFRPKKSWKPESPIHLAALRGNPEVVRELAARGVDVNAVIKPHNGWAGRTPLMNAAKSGNLEVVRLLVKLGARVNARDECGHTALTWAKSEEVKTFLTELLKQQPIEVRPGDLAAAVQDGLTDRIDALVDAGASIDDVNPRGESALIVAVEKNDLKMARLLIERGADVNFRSKQGSLPITSYTINKRMVRLLLENGADPNAIMYDDVTALRWAFQSGSKQLVQAMLEAGGKLELDEGRKNYLVKRVRALNRGVLPLLRDHLGTEEDDMDRFRAHVREFARLSETPEFQATSQRIGELFHRKPSPWKRRKGVVYYHNVSLTKHLSGHYGEPAGNTKDIERAWNLFACYGREVLDEGYTLIIKDPLSETGRFPLLLFPTDNKYAVLAAMGTNGANYGLDTDALIRWFLEIEKAYPFHLVDAGHDFVGGRFTGAIADPDTLVQSMLEICSTVRDFADSDSKPWTEAAITEALVTDLKKDGSFAFWWD